MSAHMVAGAKAQGGGGNSTSWVTGSGFSVSGGGLLGLGRHGSGDSTCF